MLVNAVHEHKELLFSYGHSLDKEREQLKKMTSTAGPDLSPFPAQLELFVPETTEIIPLDTMRYST